jgi:stage V sporulation protein G
MGCLYPGQINSKGEIKDICFPYTREARAELESAVVTAYQQALTQGMNRSPQSAPDPTAQQAQKMGM